MKNILFVKFNNETVLEFDRNKTITEEQRQYLDNMDSRMNEGIHFEGDFISPPNPLQKAQYITHAMLDGLLNKDSNQAIAMSTYLGDRMPDLKEISCKGQDNDEGIKIEFIYDRDGEKNSKQIKEETIQFFDPKDFVKKD